MRKFVVNVNGNSYQVEIEEVGAFVAAAAPVKNAAPAAPVTAPAPLAEAVQKPAETAAPISVEGGIKLESPMPGTIVRIVAETGKAIKKGDTVVVLESMKMENDIVAPADGTVSVAVREGANINAGDIIAVIK